MSSLFLCCTLVSCIYFAYCGSTDREGRHSCLQLKKRATTTSTTSLVMPSPLNDQLPKCACRDRCQFPELPRATGHHCPGCKVSIHAVCGVHDEGAGLDSSNWCYDCWDSNNQQKKRPSKTSAVNQQQKNRATSTSKTTDEITKDAGKTSGEQPRQNLLAQPTVASRQPKKSTSRPVNLKNKIVLPKDAATVDPFLRMRVAFHLDGPERPVWLVNNDYITYGRNVSSRLYCLGSYSGATRLQKQLAPIELSGSILRLGSRQLI